MLSVSLPGSWCGRRVTTLLQQDHHDDKIGRDEGSLDTRGGPARVVLVTFL
jgi:hypothetical protein